MKWNRAILFAVALLFAAIPGKADANYYYRDGNGTLQQIFSFVCQTTTICPAQVIIDSTGNEKATTSNPFIVGGSYAGAPKALSVDSNGNLNVNASVSVSGFEPSASGARGTPLSVTTSDSSGNLPTGNAVVVSNVGSNLMYCNVNGVAATDSDQPITSGGGWFSFTIPSGVTVLHCIASGGSTTANMMGGAGLATGTGGGGGGGGGTSSVNLTEILGAAPSAANPLWISPASGATFPVTGTFWQATQPVSAASLPLPTGAATAALQSTINTTLGSPFQAGGSIGNTSFAATQATASALNATVVGTGTFAVQAAQSGAWTVGQTAGPWTINLTQLDGSALGAPSNYGTSPGTVAVQGVNAFVTNSITVTATDLSTNIAQVGGNAVVTGGTSGSQGVGGLAATGVALTGNPVLVGGSDGTDARDLSTDSSGHLIVEPGNTANTTAWLVTGTGGTFPATQSGTWNITNISGTISLPTGAATSANQSTEITSLATLAGAVSGTLFQDNVKQWGGTALGAASNYGTSPGAVDVPGVNAFVTNTVAVSGTFWPYTLGQQVAGSSVPVVLTAAQLSTLTPPAAITNYAQETGGNLATIAGAVSSSVVQSNTKQVNGVTTSTGAGAVGTGSQRVAVGQDTSTIAGAAPGINGSAVPANGVLIQGSDGTDARNISTDSSGHQIVEPGNTANTTAWLVGLNATPTIANGNGVVPTQGGSALSATNGWYGNILQGNAVLSATNGLYSNLLQGNTALSATNPIFSSITDGTNKAVVKAASTANVATDPSLVVQNSLNDPVFGAPGATACSSDTASCNLNQQMQRLAQRLSTIDTALGSPFQAGGSIGNTSFGAIPQPSSSSTYGLSPSTTSALASSQIVKSSAGNLYAFEVSADSTLSASAWWIMIFNATSLPADGSVTPTKCYAEPVGTTSYAAAWQVPVQFSTGIVIGVSTTGCFTKTASAHAFISGDAQ